MGSERSGSRRHARRWERRIGDRLHPAGRALDPVKEIDPRLFPNDTGEARREPVTSYRSLVRPFTSPAGLRLRPAGRC